MGTHYKGSKKEINTLNAYIKLMRAADTVTGCLSRSLAEENLTISQFGTLEALFHLGPQNQKEIGKKLLKTGGNITLVVDNLEKRGFIKREQDPNDGRAVIVDLTIDGQKFIEEYFPKHLQEIVNEFEILDESEKNELARICKKLGTKE